MLEEFDGSAKSLIQGDFGFPAEEQFCLCDVRLATLGIVLGKRFEDDWHGVARERHDVFGELEDGVLFRVPEIDHLAGESVDFHEQDEASHKVVDVAERTCLRTVAVDGDGFAFDGLEAEVWDDAAIGGMGAWPIRVEDARQPGIDIVLADVFHNEGLGESLAFVVACPGTVGVHVAPVGFDLRMDGGITVDLGGRRLEEAGAAPASEFQRIVRAVGVDHERFDGIAIVSARAGGTGEVVDAVVVFVGNFGPERL